MEPKTATEIPATIMVLLPVPSHTMISGASADFGKELSITRYGSVILLKVLKDNSNIAIKILSMFTIRKLSNVSYNVIPVCMNISKFLHISINNRNTPDGELKKKESMILK